MGTTIDWNSVLQPASQDILSQYGMQGPGTDAYNNAVQVFNQLRDQKRAGTLAGQTPSGPLMVALTNQGGATGSASSGFDLSGILNAIGGLFGGGKSSGGTSSGTGTNWLQTLLGGGLALAGSAQKEPGEVLQARQSLRNVFTSPQDITAPGGAFATALPVFQRQETDLLDQLQSRYAAGMPSSVGGMGGGEVEALRKAAGELTQNRQALLGQLTNQNYDRQINAANSILSNSKPDPMAAALAQLGVLLASGGLGGGGGGLGGGGATGGGLNLGSIGAAIPGVSNAISALFSGGGAAGGAGGASSFLSSMAPMALPLAAAAAAAAGTYAVGSNNANEIAHLPAAVKFLAFSNPITAPFAAFAALGAHKANVAQKAAYRKEDLSSQADQVQEIGTFFEQRLAQMGVDTSAFQARITQLVGSSESPADEQSMIAREGGAMLLAEIQSRDPSITSLNQVPGLRQEFIDYMVGNTFTSGNSSYGGGAPLNFIQGDWASAGGL